MPLSVVTKEQLHEALSSILNFENPDSQKDLLTDFGLREARLTVIEKARDLMAIAERKQPTAWGCPECTQRFLDARKAYVHIKSKHGYPDEDASISVRPLYD